MERGHLLCEAVAGWRWISIPNNVLSSCCVTASISEACTTGSCRHASVLALNSNGKDWAPPELAMQAVMNSFLATRPFSVGVAVSEVANKQSSEKGSKEQALVEEKAFDDITDQIPHIVRPMGVVEGTSYGVLILAGLAFAAAVIWAVVNELLIQPLEYTCFNHTLKLLQDDPRVTVRLGTPVSGYGQESRNRQARQRIPHRIYKDAQGTEKVLVQFHAKGPSGSGRVTAEMYQDDSKQWKHSFLHLDIENPVPQRIALVEPQYQRNLSFR